MIRIITTKRLKELVSTVNSQGAKIKNLTIALKKARKNDHRDSKGRFKKADD